MSANDAQKETVKKLKWSSEEDEQLTKLILSGATYKDFAEKYGRTVSASRNRAWNLGLLNSREWTDAQLSVIHEHYGKGKYADLDLVCRLTNKSKHAVHVKVSRLGLGDYSRPIVEARKIRKRKFETDKERFANIAEVQRRLIAERGHPRHMLGKKHTEDAKARIAIASKEMNANRTDEQKTQYLIKALKTKEANGTYAQQRPNASWKAGWRDIGGVNKYYRSKWEANYAFYLEWLKGIGEIKSWAHEPKTFWFDGVRRGCVSYLPDFLVVNKNGAEEYHEVKGWMDDRSKTKIKRMAKYHPDVKLIVIDSKAYGKLKSAMSKIVPGWEQ